MTAHQHPSSEENTPSKPPVGPPVPVAASAKPSAMSLASPTEKNPSPDLAPQKTEKPQSLSSHQLLAELVQIQARRSLQGPSLEDSSPLASPPTPPISPPATPRTPAVSPPVTPSQPLSPTQEKGGLSLSSPELLFELQQPRPLRHVNPQRGLTTVFSGRGRVIRGSAPVSHSSGLFQPPPSPPSLTDGRRENADSQVVGSRTQ